ncbi:MAG: STAS domain-containing protein [Flavobacteriales bacterium]|nr:STAS domain-containing protein [Flavobacteriales bacterium]MCB9449781.1 STAS domain-containing protein [Flavobacteriales bacterium]
MSSPFQPKLVTLLKEGIPRQQFFKDLVAGIIVGIVALPLAIAFAIASGVSPEKGLITAIIAGFIISALGGSRVQIGGPTGAFIVIVLGIVHQYGVDGLTLATFMGGFIILLMGWLRLGDFLTYIPYPLVVGFTSGIAVVIFTSQLRDLFGIQLASMPADFIDKWPALFQNFHTLNPAATGLALFTILTMILFQKKWPRIPGSLVAILCCTLGAQAFHLQVDTIGSRFGDIPAHFPPMQLPAFDFQTLRSLIQPAIAIALLGSIESLLSAVVADGMIGGRHRPNAELVAQGTANIFSALIGGIPATGAIARTATNIRSGGRTPLAGIFHALTLLLIMLLLAPYAKLIPLSCLAGILVVVAYRMGEWHSFASLLRSHRMDILILLVTFLLTVLFDLILAIEVGMALSGMMVMKRLNDSVQIQGTNETTEAEDNRLFEEEIPDLPKEIALFEIRGPLYFGATQKFRDTLKKLNQPPRVLILRMRHVPFIDATGIYRLREVIRDFEKHGVIVILSGVQKSVVSELEASGFLAEQQAVRMYESIAHSVSRAKEIINDTSSESTAADA